MTLDDIGQIELVMKAMSLIENSKPYRAYGILGMLLEDLNACDFLTVIEAEERQ